MSEIYSKTGKCEKNRFGFLAVFGVGLSVEKLCGKAAEFKI
jgi:hypothetical protein